MINNDNDICSIKMLMVIKGIIKERVKELVSAKNFPRRKRGKELV